MCVLPGPEGPEVVKGGALWDFGDPLGTLVVPFASPRNPLGVPLARPGSTWGLTENIWGSTRGIGASNYIKKLPINRQSGQIHWMLTLSCCIQQKICMLPILSMFAILGLQLLLPVPPALQQPLYPSGPYPDGQINPFAVPPSPHASANKARHNYSHTM